MRSCNENNYTDFFFFFLHAHTRGGRDYSDFPNVIDLFKFILENVLFLKLHKREKNDIYVYKNSMT